MLSWPFLLVFWLGVFIVFYAYIGYGLLLYALIRIKRFVSGRRVTSVLTNAPLKVTFIVCAYNEEDWMAEKVLNSTGLLFPTGDVRFVFVTDGSTDQSPTIAARTFEQALGHAGWTVMHQPERKGKIAAFHRAMLAFKHWEGVPDERHIIVSTDANTLLNGEALQRMVQHFYLPDVGAVAGEKRIHMDEKDAANAAGEGIYWKYESLLKKWDAEWWSVVGAAGELFAFRASVYEAVPPDTIVEDFYLTMRIAMKGYRVAYEPDAYAVERSSATVGEEMKRKVRIAAGGLQAAVRLSALLNIFRYGSLSFQYVSHRLLRWTLAPLALPLVLACNGVLAARQNGLFYQWTLGAQILFYGMALLGWLLETRKIKIKALFIPYYFCLMNYAMYAGFARLVRGKQSVVWEKSKRAA